MNDETKPAGNGGNGGLKCSACGKGMGEIRKLIVWDDGGICDECVDLCAEILREELDPGFSPPTGLPRTFPEGSRIGSVGGDTIFVVVPEHVEEVPKSWTVDDEGDELVARPPEPEPKSTDGKSGLKTASG